MRVIYADVLVIINNYRAYILLSATGLLLRKKQSITGKAVASVLSGFYSLIILIPEINDFLIGVTRMIFSVLLILIAFPKSSKREYVREYAAFFAVNFIFAGFMLAVWLFIAPDGMYFSNSVVYFDIDAGMLIILTVICYAVLNFAQRLLSHRVPVDTVYDCKIYINGKIYNCHCFLDTGNKVRDCYNGAPVMIADKRIFLSLVGENPLESEVKIRLIPCNTVSGKGLLYAFSCDKAEITGIKSVRTVTQLTVALADNRIMQGRYEGILPCDIFENITNEREKSYV